MATNANAAASFIGAAVADAYASAVASVDVQGMLITVSQTSVKSEFGQDALRDQLFQMPSCNNLAGNLTSWAQHYSCIQHSSQRPEPDLLIWVHSWWGLLSR